MSDLREGVSLAQHQALDLLDQLRAAQGDLFPVMHLDMGKARAQQAYRTSNTANKRHFALQAAAHLILAVELNDVGSTAVRCTGAVS